MAPEGKKILGFLLIILAGILLLNVFTHVKILSVIGLIVLAFFLFCINFFRDPIRKIPESENIIISPADGKITAISKIDDKDVGKNSTLISIFLNVFNIHVNRVPILGKVISVKRKDGKFVSAFRHDAAEVNEQVTTIFQTSLGTIKVKQIAGLIARRILCYANKGDMMNIGGRLGYIMFGSRTDIILPPHVKVKVAVGQKVLVLKL